VKIRTLFGTLKQISPSVVAEFSDSFIIYFPEVGGDLTAMAQLDEKANRIQEKQHFLHCWGWTER